MAKQGQDQPIDTPKLIFALSQLRQRGKVDNEQAEFLKKLITSANEEVLKLVPLLDRKDSFEEFGTSCLNIYKNMMKSDQLKKPRKSELKLDLNSVNQQRLPLKEEQDDNDKKKNVNPQTTKGRRILPHLKPNHSSKNNLTRMCPNNQILIR